MSLWNRPGLAIAAFAAGALFAGSPALAKTTHLSLVLAGKSETPPNTTMGTGKGTVTYDDETMEMSWNITFSGLTGDATAAHFHGPAKPGVAAGVAVGIKDKPIESPLIGSATLTPEQAQQLLAGMWYFNVHTAANPAGEVRGQVVKAK
jgi:hypothetical protein